MFYCPKQPNHCNYDSRNTAARTHARTQTEISEIYKATKITFCPETFLPVA